jgi:hypothetical protein
MHRRTVPERYPQAALSVDGQPVRAAQVRIYLDDGPPVLECAGTGVEIESVDALRVRVDVVDGRAVRTPRQPVGHGDAVKDDMD